MASWIFVMTLGLSAFWVVWRAPFKIMLYGLIAIVALAIPWGLSPLANGVVWGMVVGQVLRWLRCWPWSGWRVRSGRKKIKPIDRQFATAGKFDSQWDRSGIDHHLDIDRTRSECSGSIATQTRSGHASYNGQCVAICFLE